MKFLPCLSNFSVLEWGSGTSKPRNNDAVVILSMFDLFCLHSFGISTSLVNFRVRWVLFHVGMNDFCCCHPFFDKTIWQNFKPIKFCRCLKNSITMDSKVFVSTTEASFKILHNNSALQQPETVFPRDNILEYDLVIFPCVIR